MKRFVFLLITGSLAFTTTATSQDSTVVMLLEIPAGTNLKYEFNKASGHFEVEKIDGKNRRVNFLSYPGNYGYIVNTLMDTARGGDGDALDVLLISSAMPQGTELEIIPIAILHLLDHNEKDDKVIAVTVDPELRTIPCVDYNCLINEFPGIMEILKTWFTHYKGPNKVEFKEWGTEIEAWKAIDQWTIR